ncbi:VWA domain-containing protein [Novosphingobium pokkalii]|uniref:VWA domain-containing protein n=1 Tax=Novosphingobium pokkalii TaxID=1770194 RepID=UPI00362A2E84
MPGPLGGICLRGSGPAVDRVLDALAMLLPPGTPLRRLPGHIDEERLCGGTDIAASLAGGMLVRQRGLLEEARGGVLVVPMAQRLRRDVAGRVAQAMDGGHAFALVLLDDGAPGDERPPPVLMERVAFDLSLANVALADLALPLPERATERAPLPMLDAAEREALAGATQALGIASLRPLLQAEAAAQALAALDGAEAVRRSDVEQAARLVLAPRATQVPPSRPLRRLRRPKAGRARRARPSRMARTAMRPKRCWWRRCARRSRPTCSIALLPEHWGGPRAARAAGRGSACARPGGAAAGGAARPSRWRGAAGAGRQPARGDPVAAAAPARSRARGAGPIRFRRDDLRVRRFEERRSSVTVFCVDASGSTAVSRLAEAKGAAELILAQTYVKRADVAVVAFRGEGADVLLPPTRSLTRAKRALAALPGGGGTPLASGLALARQLGEAVAARGSTPVLVFLTDGSANIALDGTRGRARAQEDALLAARAIAGAGHDAVVIDISPRPRPEAARLAEAMRARYLPLPCADAHALHAAVAQVA